MPSELPGLAGRPPRPALGSRVASRRSSAPAEPNSSMAEPSTRAYKGGCPMTRTATIRVPGLKVTVPLAAAALPRDLVPSDGPAGEPVLDLVLEDGALTVRARLNGKNYRKLLKQVDEHGADNVAVALQGVLRPPLSPGDPFLLEGAGSRAFDKAPRPAEPAREPPEGGA